MGGFRRLLRRPATTLAADAAGVGLARAVQPMRQRPQIAVAFAFVVAQSGRNDPALVDSARRATPRDAAPHIMNEAVIEIEPHLVAGVAGGGARREGWEEGAWCSHVAHVARAVGFNLGHSGPSSGTSPNRKLQ